MNSPTELARRLAAQWRRPALRQARLGSASAWPLRLPIGRVPPSRMERDPESVRAHVRAWDAVRVGRVEWTEAGYRSVSGLVQLPAFWCIPKPSVWAEACADEGIRAEYAALAALCADTAVEFHPVWITRFALWRELPREIPRLAAALALTLAPGMAEGRPLRAVALGGHDSKFFEQYQALIVALLDARYDGAVSAAGLETFLDAAPGGEHWVLLADLDGALLPFERQRVRTQDLALIEHMPGERLLVVENERCLHHLPRPLPGTLAVLGCGLDVEWLKGAAFANKRLAYWGDLDTWGLSLLAKARERRPDITALLMDAETFEIWKTGRAVPEPVKAPFPAVNLLRESEAILFRLLASHATGRLEQEFLPEETVVQAISCWLDQAAASGAVPAG